METTSNSVIQKHNAHPSPQGTLRALLMRQRPIAAPHLRLHPCRSQSGETEESVVIEGGAHTATGIAEETAAAAHAPAPLIKENSAERGNFQRPQWIRKFRLPRADTIGCITGVVVAFLISLNAAYSGYGYWAYLASNTAWILYGLKAGSRPMTIMMLGYTISTLNGLYHWSQL